MTLFSDVDEPDWPSILRGVQDKLQARLHTALPGIVKTYNSATQRADVLPAVQVDGVTLPLLPDVPVAWPGGAAGFLHVPLAAGDTVMLLFSEEDFSQWHVTGSVSAPAVLQRHGLHAIAIPGLRSAKAPFGATEGHVTLAGTSEVRLGSDVATAAVALNPAVAANYTQLKSALDTVVGKLNALDPTATAAWDAAMVGWPVSAAATKVKGV